MPLAFQCPYFHREGKKRENYPVWCEGGRINFPSIDARNEHVKRYCACVPGCYPGWERCPLAVMLTNEYERNITNEKKQDYTPSRK